MTLPPIRTVLLLALAAALPAPASAQACPDGVVSFVFVDNKSIFDPQELADQRRFRWAYELVNSLHVRTRERFVRRELLLGPGDCYDPLLVEESERLLREYDFIAGADVFGLRQPDGSWHVVVDTTDEWTTQVSVGVDMDGGPRVSKLSLTEKNFLGRGILVGGFFREDEQDRDLGVRIATPRLGGTRTDGHLSLGRTRPGEFVEQGFSYPFVGEVGRWAWREQWVRRESFFPYSLGAGADPAPEAVTHILLPLDEERLEFTVAGRLGSPGNLTIVGAGVSNETFEFPRFPDGVEVVLGEDFGDSRAGDSAAAAAVRHQTLHSAGTRVNLLLGQRIVRYRQFTGLDALRGTQDVPVGADLSLTLGRTIAGLSGGEDQPDDVYTRVRAFLAVAPSPMLLTLSGGIEGRQVLAGGAPDDGWKDVLAELDALFYWQPRDWPRHTFFARLAGAGGWNVTQPFQLTLGGDTGVRGYDENDFPSGQRLVFSAEDRIFVGWPFPQLFDLGMTLFSDVGRGWAGDVPFGSDTGWRGTLGAGLRVGFPTGTRGVARIDVAWPVEGTGVGSPRLRISFRDPLGLHSGPSDPQMDRSRRLPIGPDRFIVERRR